MFKSEFEFQSALIRRLKNMGMYCRNIPDIGNVRKPFDLSVNYKGKGWALELKIDHAKSNPTPERIFKKLYPHQVANLLEFQSWKSQWISKVIAYHGCTNSVWFYDVVKEWDQVSLREWPRCGREWNELERIFELIF
jgi:hypothetical protein